MPLGELIEKLKAVRTVYGAKVLVVGVKAVVWDERRREVRVEYDQE